MPHMSLPVSCMITIYGSFSAVLQDMAEWGQVRRLLMHMDTIMAHCLYISQHVCD